MSNQCGTLLIAIVFLIACKKDNTPAPSQCDISGNYSGTFTNQFGQSGNHAYSLKNTKLVVGAGSISALITPTSAGSYTNTCDSVYIYTWNSINNSYYKLSGKFSNNRSQLAGVYVNLTAPSETGPFQLTKQ